MQGIAARIENAGLPRRDERAEVGWGRIVDAAPVSGERTEPVCRPLVVEVAGEELEAHLAASCLLEPRAGDRVVVSICESQAFVLAVLERAEAGRTRLHVGSGVAFEVEEAKLSVTGAEAIDLSARQVISLAAKDLKVQAENAGIIVKSVEIVGKLFESTFDRVKTFAQRVDGLADDVTLAMKRSVRLVSEIDQTRARHVDTRAEGNIVIHGENTCVTARQIAKIDSDQIHIG